MSTGLSSQNPGLFPEQLRGAVENIKLAPTSVRNDRKENQMGRSDR